MSVRGDCQVDFAKLLLRQPLTGSEAGEGLEDTVEGFVVGKTGFQTHLRYFLIGIVAQQLLSVGHAVASDELGERIAFVIVDTGRDFVLMDTELCRYLLHFQGAIEIRLLFDHEFLNALHQGVGGTRGIHGYWFGELLGGLFGAVPLSPSPL